MNARCRSARARCSTTVKRSAPWNGRGDRSSSIPIDMGTLISAACLHAKAGQKEEALELLERVFARGWGKRDWVEHDPDYDILRNDVRFQNLLARLK